MPVSVSTLLSKIKFDRDQTRLTSANIARADVDGYTRKVAYAEKLLSNDTLTGIKQSQISRVIDRVLQKEIRNKNSDFGKTTVLNNYYKTIEQMLGSKGDDSSYVHTLNDFAVTVGQIASITDGNKKREAVQKAQKLCTQLNTIADQVNDLRFQVDQEIKTAITSFNSLMTTVQDLNRQIVSLEISRLDTTNLEDERDLAIHKMAELAGLKLYESDNNNISLALESGDIITTLSDTYPLSYTESTYLSPGDILSPVTTFTGLDITTSLTEGKIAGLLNLRDTVLTDLQAEFDELTRVLRDTANALHNEGSALGGESTLTGLSYAPGVVGPLAGATVISGQGTLRIGVTDLDGTLLDYKDIALTDNMTITSLVATISGTAYANSNPTGDFTVTQLASGEFKITSTAGKYVAIGSAGSPKATLSATSAYDNTQAYGFSHFFGLNNLFLTGNSVANSTPQVGISNALSVNPVLVSNTNALSVGRLTSSTPAPTNAGLGITAGDATVALEIGDALTQGSLTFNAVGALNSAIISTTEYATRMMALTQSDIKTAKNNQTLDERVFNELTTLAQNKSAVDPSEEIMKIFELSTSQNLTSKALNIVQTMDKDLIDTLGR
ncbi:MAG: hypothetical protein KF798_04045 [Candidatus Paracaedibacteraceae bacterium]|nr:hypothetical protein [Candidatus Paracaedibacteraceae bacterium]